MGKQADLSLAYVYQDVDLYQLEHCCAYCFIESCHYQALFLIRMICVNLYLDLEALTTSFEIVYNDQSMPIASIPSFVSVHGLVETLTPHVKLPLLFLNPYLCFGICYGVDC